MKKCLPALAAALAVLLLAASLYFFWRAASPVIVVPEESPAIVLPPEPVEPAPAPEPPAEEAPPAEALPEEPEEPEGEPDDGLPTDQFFITPARRDYADGELQLVIPKLEVDVPVLDGVDKKALRRGVGLYDYAQLPRETRSNTSLAGHRNQIYGGKLVLDQAFSYLDLLGEGDCIYLRDDTNIYQYVFEYSKVVTPDDWGPIYKTDHSCVTLTTCTPIGVSDHRLVVRGRLADTVPASEDYAYPASIPVD